MPVGAIIKDFASPGPTPRDMAWDGKTLWACDPNPNLIYQIDPITGAVIRNFASPDNLPAGLTWDGRTLWASTDNLNRIYQLETHS